MNLDIKVLNDMRRRIAAYEKGDVDVGHLAEQLLALRDRLQFKDHEWHHRLTQEIATLDSASTFIPATDEEIRQRNVAVTAALDTIRTMVE
jgi:hypothetical protein